MRWRSCRAAQPVQRPCAARLGVVIASPPGVDAPLGQMRQVAAVYVHVALSCKAPLCGMPWGLLASLQWGSDAPSGQMRQVVACLISYQCRLQVEGAEMDGANE